MWRSSRKWEVSDCDYMITYLFLKLWKNAIEIMIPDSRFTVNPKLKKKKAAHVSYRVKQKNH